MIDIQANAIAQAKKSRNALVLHMEMFSLGDPIWQLLADALVDSKIEGYLAGLDAITDHKEMSAYERGYLEGREDSK
jgi:hypothetical protein